LLDAIDPRLLVRVARPSRPWRAPPSCQRSWPPYPRLGEPAPVHGHRSGGRGAAGVSL